MPIEQYGEDVTPQGLVAVKQYGQTIWPNYIPVTGTILTNIPSSIYGPKGMDTDDGHIYVLLPLTNSNARIHVFNLLGERQENLEFNVTTANRALHGLAFVDGMAYLYNQLGTGPGSVFCEAWFSSGVYSHAFTIPKETSVGHIARYDGHLYFTGSSQQGQHNRTVFVYTLAGVRVMDRDFEIENRGAEGIGLGANHPTAFSHDGLFYIAEPSTFNPDGTPRRIMHAVDPATGMEVVPRGFAIDLPEEHSENRTWAGIGLTATKVFAVEDHIAPDPIYTWDIPE